MADVGSPRLAAWIAGSSRRTARVTTTRPSPPCVRSPRP